MYGKNQGADQFGADEGDGLGGIGNVKAGSHEGGVRELKDLGRHARVFGDDVRDFF